MVVTRYIAILIVVCIFLFMACSEAELPQSSEEDSIHTSDTMPRFRAGKARRESSADPSSTPDGRTINPTLYSYMF